MGHVVMIASIINLIILSDSLKQCIAKLEVENNKIKAENVELKARVAKLEDKQSQNDDHVLIWQNFGWGTPAKMFFSC